MTASRQNLFKKSVFRCVHDVHQHFKSEMSPFHILIEKQCYPHGCIYFKWKCRLLAKQKKCFRNFEKVGRECFNCRYFYEEKIHQYPEFIDDGNNFSAFEADFKEFEQWIASIGNRRGPVEGTVHSVSPELLIINPGISTQVRFTGFLVRFQEGFIDNNAFDDPFFLRISSLTQQQLKIRGGDELDFLARLEIDRGRFRFVKSGSFTFYRRGEEKVVLKHHIMERIAGSVIHSEQHEKCRVCRFGILADHQESRNGPTRSLVCLQGAENAGTCTIGQNIKGDGILEQCANPKWNGKGCRQTI